MSWKSIHCVLRIRLEGEILVKNSIKDETEFNVDGLMKEGSHLMLHLSKKEELLTFLVEEKMM